MGFCDFWYPFFPFKEDKDRVPPKKRKIPVVATKPFLRQSGSSSPTVGMFLLLLLLWFVVVVTQAFPHVKNTMLRGASLFRSLSRGIPSWGSRCFSVEVNGRIQNVKESATLKINMKVENFFHFFLSPLFFIFLLLSPNQVKSMREQDPNLSITHFGFGQSPFPVPGSISLFFSSRNPRFDKPNKTTKQNYRAGSNKP